MKFLCIHASCTNPDTMKWSINRLLTQLSDDKNITFHFAQGYLDSPPPQWLAEQLEGPPHLRFFQWNTALLNLGYEKYVQQHGALTDALALDAPLSSSQQAPPKRQPPNDDDDPLASIYSSLTATNPAAILPEPWSVTLALEYLHNIMDTSGPFDGVIGVSEGASVAATLLVEDLQSHLPSTLRCALFYIGSPAMTADGTRPLTPQQDGQVITVPTCHVVGTRDGFRKGAEQLLGVCEEGKTLVVRDDGGHRIPQDWETNRRIAEWVREREREFVAEGGGGGGGESLA
ncbi:serine hydrolase-domain-containing protein [Usnea florida]